MVFSTSNFKKWLVKRNKLYCLPVFAFSLICKTSSEMFFYFFSFLFLTFKIQWISMWDLACRMTSLRYERTRMWGVLAHLLNFSTKSAFAKVFIKLAREVKQVPHKTKRSYLGFRLGDFFNTAVVFSLQLLFVTLYTVKGIFHWETGGK